MTITARQEAHARVMRQAVHDHCPEMLPVIRELHELGLIEGWRNVVSILDCGPPRPRNGINAAVFLENCKPMTTK